MYIIMSYKWANTRVILDGRNALPMPIVNEKRMELHLIYRGINLLAEFKLSLLFLILEHKARVPVQFAILQH